MKGLNLIAQRLGEITWLLLVILVLLMFLGFLGLCFWIFLT